MERSYIVSYDLRSVDKDYEPLYKALKGFPAWGKLTESTWCVVSEMSCVEIRNLLRKCVDDNDLLIVIRSGRKAAWIKTLIPNSWLKENLVK